MLSLLKLLLAIDCNFLCKSHPRSSLMTIGFGSYAKFRLKTKSNMSHSLRSQHPPAWRPLYKPYL